MATTRVRVPVYDEWGRITGSKNFDKPVGNGPANAGPRLSPPVAMPVGHMTAPLVVGMTKVQKNGLYESDRPFNGPLAPLRGSGKAPAKAKAKAKAKR